MEGLSKSVAKEVSLPMPHFRDEDAGYKTRIMCQYAGTVGSAQVGGNQAAGSAPHAAPFPRADMSGRKLTPMALDCSRQRPGQEEEIQDPSLLGQWGPFLRAAGRVKGTLKWPDYFSVSRDRCSHRAVRTTGSTTKVAVVVVKFKHHCSEPKSPP